MRVPARSVPCVLCLLVCLWVRAGYAIETPTSYGEAAKVDTPIVRVPFMKKPPVIDGVMEKGEWEDASALSGFWYDFAQAKFYFMAPVQTQLQVYCGYDKEHLYFCFTSPVYPVNFWLRARGRFPDVLTHPLYGVLWDDHIELELRPWHDIARGFQLGLLRWDVNPINTVVDWYWSPNLGDNKRWVSQAKVRSLADGKRWIIEIAIPMKNMIVGNYTGKDDDGNPYVKIPPPDGTAWRAWFVRGIGGNGKFFNAFDNHVWNTTKTKLIFDSQAPSFQINELGPIMEDVIDLHLTVKNHNSRSETVRIGFFVESAEGTIYSSYEAPELKEGMVELRPGEVRQIRLRQPFPGISRDGNVLWFDVRSAGRPAKTLFRTRLIRFHSMDGGEVEGVSFRNRRVEVIAKLRPPRKDFDFRWNWSPYTKRIAGVVDKGIHGASDEAKRAVEAKLLVMKNNEDEDLVKEARVPFNGNFACFLADVPELVDGESYKLSLLLFDKNKRIVGERNPEPFTFKVEPWQNNKLGLDDVVWEPFTAVRKLADGFETLNHRFTLAPSGLPAQIFIKPNVREVPLEKRADPAAMPPAELLAIGRGPQLRAPIRLEAVVDGKRVPAQIVSPAKLVRQWRSEFDYAAQLKIGPLDARLVTRYDCDGSMHCRLVYGGDAPVKIDSLEMVMDVDGQTDLFLSATKGGMAGADVWECRIPGRAGVVWDSTQTDMELFYTKFIPWFWFGSADRAWSWWCDSDQGWVLDKTGASMQLERDAAGKVTWRVKFVNHPAEIRGERTIDFRMLTHPAKPQPANARLLAWHYRGDTWAAGYQVEPLDLSDEYLKRRWRQASGAPKDLPYEKAATWRKDTPPWYRYGQWRNVGVTRELDRSWEDKATYLYERQIRVGRRVGGWMDEYWPNFGKSDNLASGSAHLRDPATVGERELPWHRGWNTDHMRNMYKRIARCYAANNVPNRNCTWANNAATLLESFIWDTMLVEECGSDHRSFEVDMVAQFPNSAYRYMAHHWSGLVAHQLPGPIRATPGDDKRLDRQYYGRSLINDIGTCFDGPHGRIQQQEQAIRLLTCLADFGFFEDQGTEFLPFWRNGQWVKMGEFKRTDLENALSNDLCVSVYRRALDDGTGYKAIFVIMNETLRPLEVPLHILDPQRILGGPNTLTAPAVLARADLPKDLAAWWTDTTAPQKDVPALMDLESGDVVLGNPGKAEVYGPIYVPSHEYRILYAESRAK